MEKGDGAMLQLAAGGALGVHVRDLLELQRALERDRVAEAAAEVHEVRVPAVPLRDLRDLLLSLDQLMDLVRKRAQCRDKLAPALQRHTAVDGCQSKAEQAEADHMGGQRLRRGNADLGT